MNILSEIVTAKRVRVADQCRLTPVASLRAAAGYAEGRRSLATALRRGAGAGDPVRFLCEIKRASPSAGEIRPGADAPAIAEAYRDAGAASVVAICTHGLFCGDALDRIAGSGLFSALACTDTHPRAVALESDRLQVASVAPLLAEFLLRGQGHT